MSRRAAVLCLIAGAGVASPAPVVPWPGAVGPTTADVEVGLSGALARARINRERDFNAAMENEAEALLVAVGVDRFIQLFDREVAFDYGLRFFQTSLRPDFGAGGLGRTGRVQRVHQGARGGRDATACEGCHAVGGRDGAGAATQTAWTMGDGDRLSSAHPRQPPHLLGVGLVEALAGEMTTDLHGLRDAATREAAASGRAATRRLVSKGVEFGVLLVRPGGDVDVAGVVGVDADLIVRPLGWKGRVATVRRFVEEASAVHFGLQSTMVEAAVASAPGSFGPGPAWDPDADGVLRELEDGSLTAITVYLQLLEAPQVVPPATPELQAAWARGRAYFDALGCADCHRPTLHLARRLREERSDEGRYAVEMNLLGDGDMPKGDDQVALFSDLKRHDLGPGLADEGSIWLTRPLWGVADTGPWLHDGRALTLDDAIGWHGGEAAPAVERWRALDDAARADLRVWMSGLSRASVLRPAL